jgi:hypothetical protein
MIIQNVIKGIHGSAPYLGGLSDQDADRMLAGGGISCNKWRNDHSGLISVGFINQNLTPQNLYRHVHDYAAFKDETLFISTSAGSVHRSPLGNSQVHPAFDTALDFATESGTRPGYLFFCWLVVSVKPAVDVQSVAEEIRNLNLFDKFAFYGTEGEVTAKVHIPFNQIERWEKWEKKWDKKNGSKQVCKNRLKFNECPF